MAKFDPDAYLGSTATQEPEKKKSQGFDPDAYLAQPKPRAQESAMQTFGRSAASLADTALGIPGAMVREAAYNVGRFVGQPEQQAAQMADKFLWNDQVGKFTGVTGTPGYENAPLRSAGRAFGETVGENVITPVAQATGIPEGDVSSMLNSLAMGVAPVAGRATAATGRAVKSAAQVPVDVARGAVGRATNYIAKPGETPTGYQVPSSRIPLGDTFIPAKEMAELKQGMPISEGAVRPISELAPGPVLALSGGEVPVAGQAARAFGERLGETYSNPYTAAADIGSMFLTGGIPVLTAGRGALGLAQAGADAYLGRKGFAALTPEQRTALNKGINPFAQAAGPVVPVTVAPQPNPMFTQPVAPQLGYTPAGQTAMAMPGPGRRVNIEGESFNLPYQIDVSNAQAARPQPIAPVAPTAPAANVPAQPAVTVKPVAPIAEAPKPLAVKDVSGKTPEQIASEQAILDLINSRSGRKPVTPIAPDAEPVDFKSTIDNARQSIVEERQSKAKPDAVVDTPTDAEVVKSLLNKTGNAAFTKEGNKAILDKTFYDEFASQAGATLDWTKAPDIKGVNIYDARTLTNKWAYNEIKSQRPELELDKRGPQMRTLQKEAEAELGLTGKEDLTPEVQKRIGATGAVKPAPTISPALQAALAKLQSQGKYKPPGAMEMITNEPDVIAKIKNVAWDNPEDFKQKVFMHDLGLGAGEEFIAKMRTPEGSVIRAIDNNIDSEMVQYAPNDGFLIRNYKDMPGAADYTITTPEGLRYEIQKYEDGIRKIELFDGEDMIADYVKSPDQKTGSWVVMDRDPAGGGAQMIYNVDIKFAKDPNTRRLHKELPDMDFNEIIQEQLDRLNDLKQSK